MNERKIIAILTVDDDTAMENCEFNGIPNDGTLDYLSREMGWVEQSGIYLSEAFIADEDENDVWAAYINYIANWAFEHQGDEKPCSPLLYNQWLKIRA